MGRMHISLDQAIDIHARALKGRSGKRCAAVAQLRAEALKAKGDLEGFRVWMMVGEKAARLLLTPEMDAFGGKKPQS
jgi:hypothetical protein